jgi:hypothetical protein
VWTQIRFITVLAALASGTGMMTIDAIDKLRRANAIFFMAIPPLVVNLSGCNFNSEMRFGQAEDS